VSNLPGSAARLLALSCGFLFCTVQANAAVVISAKPTNNMSCLNGVCTAFSSNANLNVKDLRKLLATTSVTVKTGSASDEIDVTAALTWAKNNGLTLEATHSIVIDAPVSDAGPGALTLYPDQGNAGGTLSFGPAGDITFLGTGNALTIHKHRYKLVNSIAMLAEDIAANPAGNFALSDAISASGQTYQSSPVPTAFNGNLEGLGNAISGLAISGNVRHASVGLFAIVGSKGHVNALRLSDASLSIRDAGKLGTLAGWNQGALFQCSTTGTKVTGIVVPAIGGLVGVNDGTVTQSSADGTVQGLEARSVGGLVGTNNATVELSAAYGSVSGQGTRVSVGGLVGASAGTLKDSFAAASVSDSTATVYTTAGGLVGTNAVGGYIQDTYSTGNLAATGGNIGGLIGYNYGVANSSYSTGSPTAQQAEDLGGLAGYDVGSFSETYWDMTTSGITDPSQGAGFPPNDPGVTGLTTTQLQSGLPSGFDTATWAENPNINGGLPYLLANPPSN